MKNIIRFVKYNNAMTMVIALIFLGGGSVFAASPELRQATDNVLIGKTETVVSVDNAAILNLDVNTFDPRVTITASTEDSEAYHVSFIFDSFDVVNGSWENVKKSGDLTVLKNTVNEADLRGYVEKQLREVAQKEIAFLKEVRDNEEKKGAQKTTVAVAYTGLLGLIIDPEEKTPEPLPPSPADIVDTQDVVVPVSLPSQEQNSPRLNELTETTIDTATTTFENMTTATTTTSENLTTATTTEVAKDSDAPFSTTTETSQEDLNTAIVDN